MIYLHLLVRKETAISTTFVDRFNFINIAEK